MVNWGGTIRSQFEEMTAAMDEGARKEIKRIFKEYCATRKRHIKDLVCAEIDEGSTNCDVSEQLQQLEVGEGMELYRLIVSKDVVKRFQDAFVSDAIVLEILKQKAEEPKALETSIKRIQNITVASRRLVTWLAWVYRSVDEERYCSFWSRVEKDKRYNQGFLKMTAHFRLAEDLLQDLLCPTSGDLPPYLGQAGTTPFFTGAILYKDKSLCDHLKRVLEEDINDTAFATQKKAKKRHAVRTFAEIADYRDFQLQQMFHDEEKAFRLVKKMLWYIGIEVKSTSSKRQRETNKRAQVVQTPMYTFALALALKKNFRNYLLGVLPQLFHSSNFTAVDREWIDDAVQLYNEAATACQKPEYQFEIVRPRGVITRVLQRRIREDTALAGAGVQLPNNIMTEREEVVTARAREELEALGRAYERANDQAEHAAERRRQAAVLAAAEDENSPPRPRSRRRQLGSAARRFVDDQAGEADDDEEEEDEEECFYI